MKDASELMREIVLLLPPERAVALGEKLDRLQQLYGTRSVVETIERAVEEALKR